MPFQMLHAYFKSMADELSRPGDVSHTQTNRFIGYVPDGLGNLDRLMSVTSHSLVCG